VVAGAAAGPATTLLLGFGALLGYRRWQRLWTWAPGLSALALRMVGITGLLPRFADGSIRTSDEAIAAHFAGLPLLSTYLPSLLLGWGCVAVLVRQLTRGQRLIPTSVALLSSLVGFLSIAAAATSYGVLASDD